MLKSDLEQVYRRRTEYRKSRFKVSQLMLGGDVLSDHLCVGTSSISRMWMSSKTLCCHVWTFPISTHFLVGRQELKCIFDSTRNFQYVHLQIHYCRTLEIYSPERLESYVNG